MKPASEEGKSPLTFGRYEALLRIGRGGMAEVYAGRVRGEAGFQKLVAIKRMLPHLAEDDRFSAMFLDEARLAAHISSPYVVTTHDLGRADDGSLYLVMELVVGATLSTFLRNAARNGTCLPLPISIEILAQAAQGLHDAHDAKTPLGDALKIVHRDVSPQNVLVGVDGRARITDFGVARAMMRRSDTSTGELKGKLAYFSPEQVRDGDLDCRSDIFALGIVAWETLTSRRLFKADNPLALLDRIMNMPIPEVRRFNEEVPEAVDAAIARALSRDRDERFADGMAFANALREAYPDYASRSEIAEYVRAEASDRIEKMEQSIRASLSRGSQPSIPSPQDARSGITRRNQLEELRRQALVDQEKAVRAEPEYPHPEPTTAGGSEPYTRRLSTADAAVGTDKISSSQIEIEDDPSELTVGLESIDEYDLDRYDDGPTYAMEQPRFEDPPIHEDRNVATSLEEFDDNALALTMEPTVSAMPGARQGGFAPQGPLHSPQRAEARPLPWKLIAGALGAIVVLGAGIAIAVALMGGDDEAVEDVQVAPARELFPRNEPKAIPSDQTARDNVVEPDTRTDDSNVPSDRASGERSPRDRVDPKASEEQPKSQNRDQPSESAKTKVPDEPSPKVAPKAGSEAKAATKSTTPKVRKSAPRRTTSTRKSPPPVEKKATPTKDTNAERKHGRGGIRLDF